MAKTLSEYLSECYQRLTKHCYHNNGTPIFDQEKIDRVTIACQFDLLVLIKGDFSSLEKIALLTAKEYWLQEAVELTAVMQLLAQKLSEGLAYKTPKIRAKRQCLLALLAMDTESLFDGLEGFFESFAVLDIPVIMVKPVLDNHFDGVLKSIEYKAAELSNGFSFKAMG